MTGLPSLVVCFSSQKNTFLFKELQLAGIPVVVITDNFNIDSGPSYLIRCNYKAIFFKSFFIKMIINSAQLGRKKLFISKKFSLRKPVRKSYLNVNSKKKI
jgi:ribosomal protein S2